MVMIQVYSAKFMVGILSLLLSLFSCEAESPTAHCSQTQETFVTYFNSGEFHKIPSLFAEDSKTKSQFKKMVTDMEYIRTVVGNIKTMNVVATEKNKVSYLSTHEITTMDVSFLFNRECKLTSMLITNHFPKDLPKLTRNTTSLSLPFNDEWYVFWGGTTVEQNYHNAHQNMKGAFDFLVYDKNGKSYRTDGKRNEDYYAFGKKIIAPCDGEVVRVIKGVKDNVWPNMNKMQSYGNTVVIKTAQQEFLLFAHMQAGSVVVQEGQKVVTGQKLGLCGNSGYSTEPHLHFIVQNVADLFHPTGAYCYFDNILVNGQLKEDYMPIRQDRIKNNKP